MNIVKHLKTFLLLSLLFVSYLSSYAQEKNNFYDSQVTLIALKKSVLDAIDNYPKNQGLNTSNFRVLMSKYFDSASFISALDSLQQYDYGSFSNYYIMISIRSGEMTVIKIFIRGYSKTKGKEILYNLAPLYEKDIQVNNYFYNKRVFNNVFKKMKPTGDIKDISTEDLLSISVYKTEHFETKLFKANRLPPEYFKKIYALLGEANK